MKDEEIFSACISHWGKTSQILMCIEELNELALALCHSLRANKPFDLPSIAEEMVDVQLMLDQLQYLFNIKDFELKAIRRQKRRRLIDLINNEQKMDSELGELE